MTPLVHLFVRARRAGRVALPIVVGLVFSAIVAADAAGALATSHAIAALVALVVVLAVRFARRLRGISASRTEDTALGMLLVVLTYGLIVRFERSLDGTFSPAVLACVGVVAAFCKPGAAIVVAIAAAGLEVACRSFLGGLSADRLGPRLAFVGVFGLQNAIVLRAEIARLRKASSARLTSELAKMRDDARSYRLLGAGRAEGRERERERDEERLVQSGVEEIHQAVLFALKLLRESLDLYTAVLLWRSDAGTHLRISELSTDATNLCEGPFLTGDGVFGAVLTQGGPVSLAHLKPSYKLPYYMGPCPVRAVCALPIFEHGALRGLIVADRVADRAFTDREMDLIDEAGRYAVRAIQNERVFVQLERAKVEQGKLYRAAEGLGAATTESGVIEAGVKSAREITSVDYAAVTLFDEKTRQHEIRAVSGDEADIVGQVFRHNTGLVSMVVQNKHPLPYRGEYDARHQVVFTRRVSPPAMPSIVVLPLVVQGASLGTLVLGSRRPKAFSDAVRGTLEVLASHMAVSLSNARMMKRLEELATLDGLTGLFNKRALLEMAEQKLTAAKRFHRKISVLVTDIDHFKKVNDTYGHDVGDVVIKGLGDILRRAKRNTDVVARFGGEEFVIICEETDAKGAMLLAERVREELKRTAFHPPSKSGAAQTLQVTCSIGVATFPEVGPTWDDVFKAADEALYTSKRSGRDRSTAWAPNARAA